MPAWRTEKAAKISFTPWKMAHTPTRVTKVTSDCCQDRTAHTPTVQMASDRTMFWRHSVRWYTAWPTANANPVTDYVGRFTANTWAGKRSGDAQNRVVIDAQNGRLYVGNGIAAPTGYIGGDAGSIYIGGNLPLIPLSNGTQDLGLSTPRWRNLWLSGNAAIGGSVGFYGTAPAAKPTVTGSRGGNAALASLLAALAGLGLLTDSSTA